MTAGPAERSVGRPARGTRPANRRQLIIAAAADLFSRKGYAAVAMGDVADAVAIGPSALYRHFRGKQDLLAAVVGDALSTLDDAITVAENERSSDVAATLAVVVLRHRGAGVLWQREARQLSAGDRAKFGAAVEQIATGFTFTEGPIWMTDGSLHFSDMPGDKRRRWHPTEGVTVLRDPSNKCNGMTLDNDGNLIVCEHVTSSVVREKPDGTRETLATHWQGKELNSPNDVIVASDGSIIFTDPTYGRMPGFGLERETAIA